MIQLESLLEVLTDACSDVFVASNPDEVKDYELEQTAHSKQLLPVNMTRYEDCVVVRNDA